MCLRLYCHRYQERSKNRARFSDKILLISWCLYWVHISDHHYLPIVSNHHTRLQSVVDSHRHRTSAPAPSLLYIWMPHKSERDVIIMTSMQPLIRSTWELEKMHTKYIVARHGEVFREVIESMYSCVCRILKQLWSTPTGTTSIAIIITCNWHVFYYPPFRDSCRIMINTCVQVKEPDHKITALGLLKTHDQRLVSWARPIYLHVRRITPSSRPALPYRVRLEKGRSGPRD